MRLTRGLALAAMLGGAMIVPLNQAIAQQGPVAVGEWADAEGGRARLVLGAVEADGSLPAALQIKLDDGWKTYWRAPGPLGIPPVFDASRSDGVALERVEFPAPVSFDERDGTSTGYSGDVTLPVDLEVTGPDGEGVLRLDAFMGFCAEICVPVSLSFEGPVASGLSTPFAQQELVRRARLALPRSGENGLIEARLDGTTLLLSGAPLEAEGAEIFVAPPEGVTIEHIETDGPARSFEIVRGAPVGALDVVVVGGEGPMRRATSYKVALGE